MSDKKVSEMTDDEIRDLCRPTMIWDSSDVFDDIAEMIAEWYGRSVIDADRDLARQIVDRVRRDRGQGSPPVMVRKDPAAVAIEQALARAKERDRLAVEVDRVARLIAEAVGSPAFEPLRDTAQPVRDRFRHLARQAISALDLPL